MELNIIRKTFLDFFAKNDHKIIPSSSLVPHNDPTLMFTSAGMVQFKNIFTGEEKVDFSRATSSQKCVRAGGKHNDLDNVGYTARHHTFFEMLGNFSFGDYFKEAAIYYAWECLTKEFSLPKEKLYITVYHTDDEAANYWKKIAGLADDRIIRIATNDNFWSAGSIGPCGPCTEIFYDHGDQIFGSLPGTKDADGDRYVEIWNLVFMQFDQLADGTRINLPKPCVDTGMGIERIAAVLQNVHNNYDTDLFKNLIHSTENIVKKKAEGEALASYRVIADHLRSTSFLIADGVLPSNEGRGYVLRRIMRRAMRHVHQLGYDNALMHQLVDALIIQMGEAYPELVRAKKLITETLLNEEIKFRQTLSKGMKMLNDEIAHTSDKLSGQIAFKLYDTYGFPLDLTVDILKSKNMEVDIEGFDSAMNEQKEKARSSWKGSGESSIAEVWFDLQNQHGATEFLGYSLKESQGNVLEIIESGDNKLVITNQTPFYGESGGQMGDTGLIIDSSGKEHKVLDTKKFLGKIIAHVVDKNSTLKKGDIITLKIDDNYRKSLRANHSATHLLHHALRDVLGEHVVQKGSLVAHDKLRFDFAHSKALSTEEIEQIELIVNQNIRENSEVVTKLMNTEDAMKEGAMALFGEKYDSEVRVVSMSNSIELCGGTHVERTGDIGFFKITTETAIASGVRRIEALTAEEAIRYSLKLDETINNAADILKSAKDDILKKIDALINDRKKLEKELAEVKKKLLLSSSSSDEKVEIIGKYNFLSKQLENTSPQDLRSLVETLANNASNTIIAAFAIDEGKASCIIAKTKDIGPEINAANLIKVAMENSGGKGGGGRDTIAQAGGFEFSLAAQAIEAIKENLR